MSGLGLPLGRAARQSTTQAIFSTTLNQASQQPCGVWQKSFG